MPKGINPNSDSYLASPLDKLYTKIKKLKHWHVYRKIENPSSLCVSDGFYTYWGIIYDNLTLGYDMPERIPEYVKKWIRNNSYKIVNPS